MFQARLGCGTPAPHLRGGKSTLKLVQVSSYLLASDHIRRNCDVFNANFSSEARCCSKAGSCADSLHPSYGWPMIMSLSAASNFLCLQIGGDETLALMATNIESISTPKSLSRLRRQTPSRATRSLGDSNQNNLCSPSRSLHQMRSLVFQLVFHRSNLTARNKENSNK